VLYGFEAKLKTYKRPVGWVSPLGRNPTKNDAYDSSFGLRDEAANPTYEVAKAPAEYLSRYQVGYTQHLRDALPNATCGRI